MMRVFCSYFRRVAIAVVLLLVSFPAAGLGESLVMDDESEIYSNITESGTIGQPFEIESVFSITGLGVFDLDFDGLSTSHEVAIWSYSEDEETGVPILDALVVGPTTVTSGGDYWDAESSLGRFIVQSITPVVLQPGKYIVGGHYDANSDSGLADGPYNTTPGVERPEETYWVTSSDLTFPTESYPVLRTFVTFTGVPYAVPEPSVFVLALIGLSMLVGRRR